jgi:hypothetical protein
MIKRKEMKEKDYLSIQTIFSMAKTTKIVEGKKKMRN